MSEENLDKPEVGSYILVRFNFNDEEGNTVEEKQFHGKIKSISDDEVEIKNPTTGEVVSLPPQFGSYEPAEKGEYELPSRGETIKDPDFITEWTLRIASER